LLASFPLHSSLFSEQFSVLKLLLPAFQSALHPFAKSTDHTFSIRHRTIQHAQHQYTASLLHAHSHSYTALSIAFHHSSSLEFCHSPSSCILHRTPNLQTLSGATILYTRSQHSHNVASYFKQHSKQHPTHPISNNPTLSPLFPTSQPTNCISNIDGQSFVVGLVL
jgi:hypothetical protein